jgi:RNA polymerase sigma factor FliA
MNEVHVMITPKETNLVRKIAAEVYTSYCPASEAGDITREDLYHYGIMGLLEVKPKYDKSRGVPWLAFAAFRIRGAMLDQIRRQPMVRIPQAGQQKVKQLKEARKELAQTGIIARPETLAEKLGWSLEEVHEVSEKSVSLLSVQDDFETTDNEFGFMGVTLADERPSPEAKVMHKEMADLINQCLEGLPSSEDRLIIISRVCEGLKLKELAEVLGCSSENVRQRQKQVEKLMKMCMEHHGWDMKR